MNQNRFVLLNVGKPPKTENDTTFPAGYIWAQPSTLVTRIVSNVKRDLEKKSDSTAHWTKDIDSVNFWEYSDSTEIIAGYNAAVMEIISSSQAKSTTPKILKLNQKMLSTDDSTWAKIRKKLNMEKRYVSVSEVTYTEPADEIDEINGFCTIDDSDDSVLLYYHDFALTPEEADQITMLATFKAFLDMWTERDSTIITQLNKMHQGLNSKLVQQLNSTCMAAAGVNARDNVQTFMDMLKQLMIKWKMYKNDSDYAKLVYITSVIFTNKKTMTKDEVKNLIMSSAYFLDGTYYYSVAQDTTSVIIGPDRIKGVHSFRVWLTLNNLTTSDTHDAASYAHDGIDELTKHLGIKKNDLTLTKTTEYSKIIDVMDIMRLKKRMNISTLADMTALMFD